MSTSMHQNGPLLKKSRTGCRDCRRRKVKCDETKPICLNCRRRYINIQRCDWGSNVPRDARWLEDRLVPRAQVRSLSLHPSSVTSNTRWRSLELRLVHHYAVTVSSTMPDCDSIPMKTWKQTIPQLSFSSEMMLNPMLAVSAIHLHGNSPTDLDAGLATHRYFGRALTYHSRALSGSGEGSPEQFWLSAVLLCHISWLLENQRQPNMPYKLPIQAWKIARGVATVFLQLKVQGYSFTGPEALPRILSDEELPMVAVAQLHDIEVDLAHLLNAFNVQNMPQNLKSFYIEGKSFILFYYRAFYSGADEVILQLFLTYMLTTCQAGYIDLLERHDPLAMALMIRPIVLLTVLDSAWWMSGIGDYEAVERNVRGVCQLMPEHLLGTMDWPCMVLDKKFVLSRDYRS